MPQPARAAADIIVAADECRFTTDADCRLISRDLNSSVAVAVHAPKIGLAALLRFSQPDSAQAAEGNPWVCADTAIPLFFDAIREMGAAHRDLSVYAAGGAFATAEGKANVLALRRLLWREGILLKGSDTGGSVSRSLWLEAGSGRIIVRSHNKPARIERHSAMGDQVWHFAS